MSLVERLLTGDRGQTSAEYGVVLGVICLAVVVAMTLLSGAIDRVFSSI
ncbi:MAG TPA: hypothetical protein VMU66_03495 [Gaiellales bacterium]|nr:hypothetical protein [Gaiellales bacterium]